MKLASRAYCAGDEEQINKLFNWITNRTRTLKEYRWEWLDTWDGQGSIWLLFDEDRAENDRLIAQYSLIPTPFSIFGKTYVAGKTENCMSHPDYRGKSIYFPHEKKYFEEAKKRFQVFLQHLVMWQKEQRVPLENWDILPLILCNTLALSKSSCFFH